MYMRLAAHDIMALNSDPYGRPRTTPYCLVNADRWYVQCMRLSQLLHRTDAEFRGDETDSLIDFISRLDEKKTLWRPPRRDSQDRVHHSSVYLNTDTNVTIRNTGIGELIVGEQVYAMPAIGYLTKNNPSVNTFMMDGKLYLHPMLMTYQDKKMLTDDLLSLQDSVTDGKTTTLIGGMLKKNAINKTLDIDKMLIYMQLMNPIGVVTFNQQGNCKSIYDVVQNTVPLGGDFTLMSMRSTH